MGDQDPKLPFSQREGLLPRKTATQINNVDDALRNRIWNALDRFYWQDAAQQSNRESTNKFSRRLQDEYFKQPWNFLLDVWPVFCLQIRSEFFKCEWYEVYDFIEYLANYYPNSDTNSSFTEESNKILEEERSAYRFISGIITPITSAEERAAIEEALNITSSHPALRGAYIHIRDALILLSDRKNPIYRNSVKESISAVESICQRITGTKKATLGDALKMIDRAGKIKLHGALSHAFSSLYGYTSDANGIRHALLDEPNLDLEDAQFMLVSCSAFVNYLFAKAVKAGVL
jgi:hypothetical protein